MGNGSMCVGNCTPAQQMAYMQSSAGTRINNVAAQNQQSVGSIAKVAETSVPARPNSILDIRA